MHKDNEDDLSYFYFFENWFLMAEGRDTDEKRLIFYDTIMRYAFDGQIPEKPVRGVSPGKVWAAWDAYLLTHPVIDAAKRKISARILSGKAGRGTSRNRGNQNARKEQTIQNQYKINTKSIREQNNNIIKEKEKEKDNNNNNTPQGVCACDTELYDPFLPTREEQIAFARQVNVPESFVDEFLSIMKDLGWEYVNRGGTVVRLSRRNFKAVLKSFYRQREKEKRDGLKNRPNNIKSSEIGDVEDVF